jgi:hypothetical protein
MQYEAAQGVYTPENWARSNIYTFWYSPDLAVRVRCVLLLSAASDRFYDWLNAR